jgi:hypothetical protein
MQSVNFKGTPFFMNGKEYIIPSLSLKQVETNYDKLASAATALEASSDDATKTVVDTFKTYIPIIAQAIQRNYPEVTEENLWDWLDLGNFSEILVIVQSRSGFKATTTGEALPAAE